MERYNERLLEMADYTDLDRIKTLFKNYEGLLQMQNRGDMVAESIRIDLDNALKGMNKESADAIHKVWIEGWNYNEYGKTQNIGDATINRRLKKGLEEARTILEGL